MTVGIVVLTQGRRPAELAAALESVRGQRGIETDVAVVGNGWTPVGLPEGVHAVALEENRGIPAGRNAGVPAVNGDLLVFLDDDVRLATPDALARIRRRFLDEPDLGLLQPRVDVSDGGPRPRDWVPRLRVGDPARSSDVTAVWDGAVAIRRSLLELVGGWPDAFRLVHDGVDLAWRVMDRGYRVAYAGDIAVLHRGYQTAPHDYSAYYGARNRVWLARRHLPLPLGVLYVATFVLRSLPLMRSAAHARAALRGYRDGFRLDCGPRRRLRARTLWQMTRNGRPPVI